jgi:hypothetical protein
MDPAHSEASSSKPPGAVPDAPCPSRGAVLRHGGFSVSMRAQDGSWDGPAPL